MKKSFIKRMMIQYVCRDFGTRKRSELNSSGLLLLVVDKFFPLESNLQEVYECFDMEVSMMWCTLSLSVLMGSLSQQYISFAPVGGC
jgi:hypothetical protein